MLGHPQVLRLVPKLGYGWITKNDKNITTFGHVSNGAPENGIFDLPKISKMIPAYALDTRFSELDMGIIRFPKI